MHEQSGNATSKGIFGNLSVTSVMAAALAAMTSFSLQAHTGLAGSLGGAAIAAVATTIATQVYKNMIVTSSAYLRLRRPTHPSERRQETSPRGDADECPKEVTTIPTEGGIGSRRAAFVGDATHLGQVASARRARELRVRVALFSAVAAVLISLVTAGIIMMATHGSGIPLPPAVTATDVASGPATETVPVAQDTSDSQEVSLDAAQEEPVIQAEPPEQPSDTLPETETSSTGADTSGADTSGADPIPPAEGDSQGTPTATPSTPQPEAGEAGSAQTVPPTQGRE